MVVSRTVNGYYARLKHQNQELLALHEASLRSRATCGYRACCRNVVNEASAVIGARYGAISYGERLPDVDIFVTSGIDGDERRRIGNPPLGRGVLGIPIESAKPCASTRSPAIRAPPVFRPIIAHASSDRGYQSLPNVESSATSTWQIARQPPLFSR
jgi:hypothetical protein